LLKLLTPEGLTINLSLRISQRQRATNSSRLVVNPFINLLLCNKLTSLGWVNNLNDLLPLAMRDPLSGLNC